MKCFQKTAKSLPVDFEIIIKKKKSPVFLCQVPPNKSAIKPETSFTG